MAREVSTDERQDLDLCLAEKIEEDLSHGRLGCQARFELLPVRRAGETYFDFRGAVGNQFPVIEHRSAGGCRPVPGRSDLSARTTLHQASHVARGVIFVMVKPSGGISASSAFGSSFSMIGFSVSLPGACHGLGREQRA